MPRQTSPRGRAGEITCSSHCFTTPERGYRKRCSCVLPMCRIVSSACTGKVVSSGGSHLGPDRDGDQTLVPGKPASWRPTALHEPSGRFPDSAGSEVSASPGLAHRRGDMPHTRRSQDWPAYISPQLCDASAAVRGGAGGYRFMARPRATDDDTRLRRSRPKDEGRFSATIGRGSGGAAPAPCA